MDNQSTPSRPVRETVCTTNHQETHGVLQRFEFHVPVRRTLTEYLSVPSAARRVAGTDFDSIAAGETGVIFNIKLTVCSSLTIQLNARSQKYSSVRLVECSAVPKGWVTHAPRWNTVDFKPVELVAGTEQRISPYSTFYEWSVTKHLLKGLPEPAAEGGDKVQEPHICISGSIFYHEPSTFKNELKVLFNNAETSDVEIFVGDEKFVGHKCILSSRSSFFQAMFSSNMRESIENVVRLSEDDSNVFEQVLSYIYTDTCPKVSSMATDLLVCADKYGINGLRLICEEEILRNIKKETVCDYLVQSALANSKQIYDECVKFIIQQIRVVMKTDGWNKMKEMDRSGKLMADILEQMHK